MDTPITQPRRKMRRRKDASAFLREEYGIPAAYQTLSRLAVEGTGPEFVLYGRVPLYPEDALRSWAEARLSRRFKSTSEASVQRGAGSEAA